MGSDREVRRAAASIKPGNALRRKRSLHAASSEAEATAVAAALKIEASGPRSRFTSGAPAALSFMSSWAASAEPKEIALPKYRDVL